MHTELSKDKLLKRGFCCGLKCKNCPYDPCHIKDNTNVKEHSETYFNPHKGSFSKLKKTSHWDWDFTSIEELLKIISKSKI